MPANSCQYGGPGDLGGSCRSSLHFRVVEGDVVLDEIIWAPGGNSLVVDDLEVTRVRGLARIRGQANKQTVFCLTDPYLVAARTYS